MADASCQMKSVEVTITHFSLLALLSSFLQPCSYSWRSKCLGSIIWQADVYASRPKCFPWISTNRIQWRKHAFLDGLWGTETGVQQKCHWRKSKANLWRLHFYPFSKRGIITFPNTFFDAILQLILTCLKPQKYPGITLLSLCSHISLLTRRDLGLKGKPWGEIVGTTFSTTFFLARRKHFLCSLDVLMWRL